MAFTFGGVAVFFGLLAEGPEIFSLMPHRIWSIMNNTILMAIPLFIFMGIVLQKSNLAERLLESMGFLFGEVRGGIAISTILVGALLAASTGVVGASVVAMGVISLPVMLKYRLRQAAGDREPSVRRARWGRSFRRRSSLSSSVTCSRRRSATCSGPRYGPA